jgi:hypothetical protein
LAMVAADQRITIRESEATGVGESRVPIRAELSPPVPNPTWGSTLLSFDLPAEQRVRIDVLDVACRYIRRLEDRTVPAGHHDVWWDGLDAGGQAVPAGIYWVRFEAGARPQARPLVRLR